MLAITIIIYTLAVILVILYETSHYREYEQDTDWKRVTVLSLLWPALSVWGMYGRIRDEVNRRHLAMVTEDHDDTVWTTTGDEGKYTVMDVIDGVVPGDADADATWDFPEQRLAKVDDDSIAERLYRLERDRARMRSRALHPSNQPDDLFSDDQGGFYWSTDDESQ